MTAGTLTRDDVALLVADVAGELGTGWSSATDDAPVPRHRITGPATAHLCVRTPDDGSLVITGVFPTAAYNVLRIGAHGIGVSADRGPVVIAREIRRRLLPGYLAELERAHHVLAAADAAEQRRHELRDQLLTVVPGSVVPHRETAARSVIALDLPGEMFGELEVSDRRCSLELRGLDIATTHRLLAVLAGEGTP